MPSIRIAVLMTCHNRKNKTLECLQRLRSQSAVNSVEIKVYLVDDGSTDGTGEAVSQHFPEVKVLYGDGNLFWCGGMRLAFGEALKGDYDFYLWLNDDTNLYQDALQKLLDTYYNLFDQLKRDMIVVGSLCNKNSNTTTYGGSKIKSRWNPNKYIMLQPTQYPQQCDVFNGNCVLIPQKIAFTVGNLSNEYKHGAGDIDYGMRVLKSGFSNWICSGYIGVCTKNKLLEQWRNQHLSIKDRIRALNHPIIIARVKDWVIFVKNYYIILWPFYYIRSFIRLRFPRIFIFFKSLAFNVNK